MAQAEPSDDVASYDGEDGGRSAVVLGRGYSGVAGDECFTASASTPSTSQCRKYVTAGMSEQQIWALIETSREQGMWSELKEGGRDGAAESIHAGTSSGIWEELKRSYPRVFTDLNEVPLQLGRVIAEGGQGTIYEAKYSWSREWDMVAKVFKMEGFSLADLQRQWPRATKTPISHNRSRFAKRRFVMGGVVFGERMGSCSLIHKGTVLKDGRFAFVMPRYWGDLRTLINMKVKDKNSQGPPFSHWEALNSMFNIAWGMRNLHDRGVLHRDLKAANVLINGNPSENEEWRCVVADYESSVHVQGTQFWRAPEVLEELLKKPCDRNEGVWTEKVDIYSYAMTCYEVLTGFIPFLGYVKSDWKRVIDGERPHFPGYVDPRLQRLVERCWVAEPSERPSFGVILGELERFWDQREINIRH